jgi:hypothetical protein
MLLNAGLGIISSRSYWWQQVHLLPPAWLFP